MSKLINLQTGSTPGSYQHDPRATVSGYLEETFCSVSTNISVFTCRPSGNGVARLQLKDQYKCGASSKISIAKLLFPSLKWESGVPSPRVSWSSETLHKPRILVELLVQAWPKIETHQWLRGSFPGAAGFTLFGSVVIYNSRQLVKLLLSLILLLKKHYLSNNNNNYFCQLKYYYNSNGSLETRWGNPDLLSPFRCGIKKCLPLSHFCETEQIKYRFCRLGSEYH